MARVLYVDDDDSNRELIARRLALDGYAVTLARTASEGIGAALATPPDVVLLGLATAGSSAWEAAMPLKANAKTSRIPIIGIVANGDRGAAAARSAGCDDVEEMPVRADRLLAAVRRHVGQPLGRMRAPKPVDSVQATPNRRTTSGMARVLVVDDQEANVDLLTRRLALEGYETIGVRSGEAALACLERTSIDCVLLDVNMPDMNGFDVLALLRRRYAITDLAIIMVTAREATVDVVRALGMGANDYVTKPVDIPVLVARLAVHVDMVRLRTQLRREKELSDNLIGSAQELILSVDGRGVVTEFNRFAEAMLGWRRAEMLGRPALAVFDRHDEAVGILSRAAEGAPVEGETLLRARSGRAIPVRFSCAPLRSAKGSIDGAVMLAIDVTREREIDKERRRLERLREDFMAVATHDMKGPLSSILGFSSLLHGRFRAGDTLTPEGADFIHRIGRMAQVLKTLVEDFLDFRALQANQLTLQTDVIDLCILVRECADMATPTALARGVTLACQPATAPAHVEGDARRLRQVIGNFLDNALKFTPGGGTVTLRTRSEGSRVVVEVEDSGPGIPAADLDRIFQPWVVSTARVTGDEKSTGLGLSICAEFVRLHGGDYGARNKPEGGSVFHFALPAATAITLEEEAMATGDDEDLRARTCVLVVEDEPSSALLMQVLLSDAGYRVRLADSVESACRVIADEPCLVALLDSHVGTEDGLDVARRGRNIARRVPMALVTGESPERVLDEALALGIATVIEKPIDPARLLPAVAALVRAANA